MTGLTRVTRLVDVGTRRPVVVTLDDNHQRPLIRFREKGRRVEYQLSLLWCFTQAARQAAEGLRDQRRARRRRAS